ncbi:hypothetical protein IEQ34_010839 [Dendrobium chrysotoxum]|uniref:Aluminum resistance protein n=1 Tax=Dendrobium chrysotoxum TaxID=161865 RepID=A0AAV7GVX2_DENCH|nr:hypothetical protein IEQ34_010839 [Dendrobium chrysotoxum]
MALSCSVATGYPSVYPLQRSSRAAVLSAGCHPTTRCSAQLFVPEVVKAVDSLYSDFRQVDNLVAHNATRVLKAFQNARVGSHHFGGSTGYGHDEGGGREALDNIFAEVFGAEAAIVRSQFFSGTHAITCALFAILRPGDEFYEMLFADETCQLLAVAGAPYDTLEEVIGIRNSPRIGSLKDFGVSYREVPLSIDGGLNWDGLANAVTPQTKCSFIQRSCGYAWRKSLSILEIQRAIEIIKMQNPDCMVIVDNCYGEFVEAYEPPMVGADLIAGSLIKNPGGTIAPCGGYVAGRKSLVEMAAARLSAPGLGVDCGSTPGDVMRLLFQGLILSPQMVGEAIKAVQLGCRERLIAFCEAVQRSCHIGSFIKPTAGCTPGYASEVIFADGTFIDGSTRPASRAALIESLQNSDIPNAYIDSCGKVNGPSKTLDC